jgi:hypothetical protein
VTGWRNNDPHLRLDRLINSEAVVDTYGCWPSFHDAEIHRMTFERSPSAWIEVVVHCFEITNKVTEMGYLKLEKHNLVTFRFDNVTNVQMQGHNRQNAIFGLSLNHDGVPAGPEMSWRVRFDAAHGADLQFSCEDAIVLCVEPFQAPEPLISVQELKTLSADERRELIAQRRKERRARDGG